MDFGWPTEARDRIDRARRFAQESLSAQHRPTGFDRDAWRAAAGFGLFSLALPEAWGGKNCGALAIAAVLEALGRGGADRGFLFALGAHLFGCAIPLAAYGTPRQAETWREGLGTGAVIGALAVTEPGGGSSLDHIATQALETRGGYVLTGQKTLIANAPEAGVLLVLARQFHDRGPLGLTAFLVPSGTAGLVVRPIPSSIGLPGAPLGTVQLNECFLPADAVVGRPGAGLRIFATAMQWERTCLLAGFLGAAERDLAHCVEALHARRDAQGALLRHQAVSHRLARMRLKLEGARLLLHRAAWSIDRGRDDFAASAMAKLAVSEAVVDAAGDGLRLMAGTAWLGGAVDFGAAVTDVLGGLFASGTSEVQLDILARDLQPEHRPA